MKQLRGGFGWKIKTHDHPLPNFMWGVIDAHGLLEVTETNYKESYILLFATKELAQAHIDKMNNDFCIWPDGTKSYWYKNRGNNPIEINTRLQRFKSKYMSMQQAFNKLYN